MKEQNNSEDYPEVKKTTDADVEMTIKKIEDKYDIVITNPDARKFAELTNNLAWWITVEEGVDSSHPVPEDLAKKIREIVKKHQGKNITLKEASDQLQEKLLLIMSNNKEKIANQMKAILAKYK